MLIFQRHLHTREIKGVAVISRLLIVWFCLHLSNGTEIILLSKINKEIKSVTYEIITLMR